MSIYSNSMLFTTDARVSCFTLPAPPEGVLTRFISTRSLPMPYSIRILNRRGGSFVGVDYECLGGPIINVEGSNGFCLFTVRAQDMVGLKVGALAKVKGVLLDYYYPLSLYDFHDYETTYFRVTAILSPTRFLTSMPYDPEGPTTGYWQTVAEDDRLSIDLNAYSIGAFEHVDRVRMYALAFPYANQDVRDPVSHSRRSAIHVEISQAESFVDPVWFNIAYTIDTRQMYA